MQRYVVVMGESLTDLIEGTDNSGAVYRPRAGGSPFNVAVGVRRLGASTEFVSAFGDDTFGRRLQRFLTEADVGIGHSAVTKLGSCVSVATVVDGRMEYEYFGDAASMLQLPAPDTELLAGAAVVHAGSTAFNADPAYSAVVGAMKVSGPVKTMDPNPRPFLIEHIGDYRRRWGAAAGLADLIKLSGEDAEFLYPGASLEAVLHAVRGDGDAPVIMTRAGADTVLLYNGRLSSVRVVHAELVDPTGAGDSFTAWVLRHLVDRGLPTSRDAWHQVIEQANAAAAITCSRIGGAESMPTMTQLGCFGEAAGAATA